jgi:hypothetical protein
MQGGEADVGSELREDLIYPSSEQQPVARRSAANRARTHATTTCLHGREVEDLGDGGAQGILRLSNIIGSHAAFQVDLFRQALLTRTMPWWSTVLRFCIMSRPLLL